MTKIFEADKEPDRMTINKKKVLYWRVLSSINLITDKLSREYRTFKIKK